MFSSGPSYQKLKTNLRLCINRLKLLEKKKTEMALKSRKEIADYVAMGKTERAKIRVEHIIREDYLVEALEILEMFCDLLLARFGLIQQMKTLDDGLAEAISSLIWVAPRLQADVQELKIVSDQLSAKYGKPYALACRENSVGTVSEKLMHKLSVQAPPKLTVEKYMVEIAKYYNVEYEPDPQVMGDEGPYEASTLIDLGPAPPAPEKNDLGGAGGGAAAPPPPPAAQQPQSGGKPQPFNYPSLGDGAGAAAAGGAAAAAAAPYPPQAPGAGGFNIPAVPPPGGADDAPPAYFPPDLSQEKPPMAPGVDSGAPPMAPGVQRSNSEEDNTRRPGSGGAGGGADFPELPEIPDDLPAQGNSDDERKGGGDEEEEIDFDDLTKRFEALKKKK